MGTSANQKFRIESRRMGLLAGAAFLLVTISNAQTYVPTFPQTDSTATFLIRVSWVNNSDGLPQQTTGTGVTVDAEGTVMTVKHLLPDGGSSSAIEILAQASPSDSGGFHLKCEPVPQVDLAFCKPLDEPKPYPFPAHIALMQVSESQSVWIRGFPKGGPLEGAPGQIKLVENPLAKTSALLLVGYSGGPVYFEGKLIGLVHDGEPVADVSDPNVMGLGRFTLLADAAQYIPSTQLHAMLDSQNIAVAALDYFNRTNTVLAFNPLTGGFQEKVIGVPPINKNNPQPEIIRISYSVDETNDKHQGLTANKASYTTGIINSTPGYKIIDYKLDKLSVTKLSDEKIELSNEGRAIQFSYKLESGPIYDRYRGWLKGRLILTEQLIK